MKYYIEYKDREEFDKINDYYKIKCAFIDPKKIANNHPPGFIIENNKCIWKLTSNPAPKDAKKITFQEWKEMVHLENKLNSKLEWKPEAYVKYLGTKQGQNSGKDWEKYFNQPGLKAGDVGIISTTESDKGCWVKDKIRPNSNGLFSTNYPKTETFEISHDSPLDLKFVVKSSMNVLKLLDKLKGSGHDYEDYGFTYKYINYPFCNGSHLCDSIPSGYVEISEHEAIDRLTSIINGTFLIRTRPSVHSDVSNGNPDTYSNTTVSTKKQSLTEQLCKIIEKEPDNISVTSLFPTKRKSIINNLKF